MAAKTVKAVVALRKTVWIDNKQFGPGAEISLPADEIEHLRERGFLVDPDAAEVPTGEGPSFDSADPNAVTVTAS
jgi:hypothetical protein